MKADLIAMWMGINYVFIDEALMIGCETGPLGCFSTGRNVW